MSYGALFTAEAGQDMDRKYHDKFASIFGNASDDDLEKVRIKKRGKNKTDKMSSNDR